jgi:hypothetical protein
MDLDGVDSHGILSDVGEQGTLHGRHSFDLQAILFHGDEQADSGAARLAAVEVLVHSDRVHFRCTGSAAACSIAYRYYHDASS